MRIVYYILITWLFIWLSILSRTGGVLELRSYYEALIWSPYLLLTYLVILSWFSILPALALSWGTGSLWKKTIFYTLGLMVLGVIGKLFDTTTVWTFTITTIVPIIICSYACLILAKWEKKKVIE